jgi:hypothetical protein
VADTPIGARVAKYEKTFEGDLDPFLAAVDASLKDQSVTATIIDSSDVMVGATGWRYASMSATAASVGTG